MCVNNFHGQKLFWEKKGGFIEPSASQKEDWALGPFIAVNLERSLLF